LVCWSVGKKWGWGNTLGGIVLTLENKHRNRHD
jgi:hypothetical protein